MADARRSADATFIPDFPQLAPMAQPTGPGADERARLAAIRSADGLADLVRLTGADSDHEAYVAAKREWRELREKARAGRQRAPGLPGARVVLDGFEFRVHGVTHAGTRAEREHLRERVARFVEDGAAVFCEQGVRSMYFADRPGVREMDDFSWAMRELERSGADATADGPVGTPLDGRAGAVTGGRFESAVDGFAGAIDALAARLRDAAFSAIDAGSAVYGEAFESTLGAVASDFLAGPGDLATGRDFESFELTRLAAADPAALAELQEYYETSLLPQPLEREWLRRHDRELELLTYARNERMADYLVYHHEDEPAVHAIVGAAHQPGVRYYLEAYRDGRRSLDGFAPVG